MSKKNRVRLADAFIAAGADPFKVLDAIRFPVVTGVSLKFFAAPGIGFGNRPDDDAAIVSDGVYLVDGRRNVTHYTSGSYKFSVTGEKRSDREIKIGSKVQVIVTDASGKVHSLKKWRLNFQYSDGTSKSIPGGIVFRRRSPGPFDPNNGHPFAYDNGGAYVPPPDGWIMPKHLAPPGGNYKIKATGARVS